MEYGFIRTPEQLKALKRTIELRIKRLKNDPDVDPYAIQSMERSIEDIMRELAMRKMFGKDWRDK